MIIYVKNRFKRYKKAAIRGIFNIFRAKKSCLLFRARFILVFFLFFLRAGCWIRDTDTIQYRYGAFLLARVQMGICVPRDLHI